jgi:hypothetical protein
MQESPAPEKDKEPEYPVKAINNTTIQLPPLNDMWEQNKQSNRRI